MKVTRAAALIAMVSVLMAVASGAIAKSCTGQVGRIIDADTIWMRCNGRDEKIRFAQIDAPEVAHPNHGAKGQPYGEQAREALAGAISNRKIRVEWEDRGPYDRIIGEVYLGSTDINAWLVAQGAAWVYDRYAHDPKLKQLESRARRQRLGLWQNPNPTAPWAWRH